MDEIDFVFIDSAGRPWRVCTRMMAWKPGIEDPKTEVWIWYWSTYDRWVPLREATPDDLCQAKARPSIVRWEAGLYHKLSEMHQ